MDSPDDKGISKRKKLEQVYKQTGKLPQELAEEVKPEFNDEPLYNIFFELFQRNQEFYQTIFYYQQIMGFEFDGEDLSLLLVMWNTATTYLSDKDKRKVAPKKNNSKPSRGHPNKRRR